MTLGERIKKARKALDLTQQKFAEQIGTTQNNIASYEIGRREPSAAAINNICKTFNVNEAWLRTGAGEMFVQLPKNEALEQQIREFLKGGNDSFRERLVSLLLRLPPEQWEALERYAQELVSSPAAPAPRKDAKPLTIDEQVELYRQQLLLEQEQENQASSVKESDAG